MEIKCVICLEYFELKLTNEYENKNYIRTHNCCGSYICNICYKYWKGSKKDYSDSRYKCPTCNHKYEEKEKVFKAIIIKKKAIFKCSKCEIIFEDSICKKTHENECKKIKLFCINKSVGCNWTDLNYNMKLKMEHEKKCIYDKIMIIDKLTKERNKELTEKNNKLNEIKILMEYELNRPKILMEIFQYELKPKRIKLTKNKFEKIEIYFNRYKLDGLIKYVIINNVITFKIGFKRNGDVFDKFKINRLIGILFLNQKIENTNIISFNNLFDILRDTVSITIFEAPIKNIIKKLILLYYIKFYE